MPYVGEISRTNPSCFLFMVDQSGSMANPFGGVPGQSKAQGVADAINRLLQNLVLKCAKSEGIRDYFYVGVIGYGVKVGPAFGGTLAGRPLVPISEIANNPLRVEQRTRRADDGAGGIVELKYKFPIWFEPVGNGKTPMCQAMTLTKQTLAAFVKKFPGCYPPLILNISDGMATDGNPEAAAAQLRLASSDGNLMLFNAHISSRPGYPIEFADKEEGLPDDYRRLLFRMSSLLPAKIQAAARSEGFKVNDLTRGFVFNADLVSVIRFLDIGTKVAHTAFDNPWGPILDHPMRCYTFHHPKRGHSAEEYEDAFAGDPKVGRFAVADGASESSFAGLWAKLLVNGFVHPQKKEDPEANWLEPLQKRWATEVDGRALPWYAEEKRQLGAYATFLGMTLKRSEKVPFGAWRAVAVGDSCLFQVRKDELIKAFPLTASKDFNDQPGLIGSRTKDRKALLQRQQMERGKWMAGDHLFLMTDALAQWFLKRCETGGKPWQSITKRLADAKKDAVMAEWIESLRDGDGLRNDDVTVLALDL